MQIHVFNCNQGMMPEAHTLAQYAANCLPVCGGHPRWLTWAAA